MSVEPKKTQLWIGLVEVRPLAVNNEVLGDAKGAFVNIVTWASNGEEYRRNAELIVSNLSLFVSEIENPEPLESRRMKTAGDLGEEIEDMVSRAENNPNAIIYGTFHTFERDDA